MLTVEAAKFSFLSFCCTEASTPGKLGGMYIIAPLSSRLSEYIVDNWGQVTMSSDEVTSLGSYFS